VKSTIIFFLIILLFEIVNARSVEKWRQDLIYKSWNTKNFGKKYSKLKTLESWEARCRASIKKDQIPEKCFLLKQHGVTSLENGTLLSDSFLKEKCRNSVKRVFKAEVLLRFIRSQGLSKSCHESIQKQLERLKYIKKMASILPKQLP
jgi:hypothetical protein